MKAVIAAGGKGTRLKANMPKALVKIGEKPVIEHQISLLKEGGIDDITVLLGHMGDQVKDYLKSQVYCVQEKEPLGTAGALKQLEKEIKEDFLFLSGDIMMDFDVPRFVGWHNQKRNPLASLIVHPNDHPLDSDLVEKNSMDEIIRLHTRPHDVSKNFQNLSIASVMMFSPEIFGYIPQGKCDVEKDVFPKVIQAEKRMYAYNTPEYFKDIGTPERLKKVNEDYFLGKISKFNLKNKRKAVFLDRDGVINEEVDQLSRAEDFKMYDFTPEAVRMINDSGMLAVIVTNQAMIAKGFMTESDLSEIHKKMETGLSAKGAKIDAVYYCPHHPEKGFKGEIEELKIDCFCRKPKIGLIEKAVSELNIDLKESFFVGDSTIDAKTAENAGVRFIGVKTGYGMKDQKHLLKRDLPLANNLLEAVKWIINP
ncbi:MAG: hypothetical protein A2365_00535 [Candidatus Nealsonbacteria bacterium RIFOXYB1_FULL_40_15]|uniref:D,D-heptose 1,7-bisphosphate phosphatase n=2 Tax=Candidatus Nealsoniibacteriota TaxID=1817911 RepID=A0A1G2ESQ9_9BACT|nr:MAG: hypothetical protein A2365_00535 [Candidatus Nealsonbacteria bacterium RIFOXYB1_FULL_40_15]OGZ28757.1 MAG: hypothetical protein A2427_01715 [Candidatus Nealsonbacteria bacterium RIFOXYC1_FULL_40_7]OGZ29036.1 MAG: hypothetical protein A2562_00965 [Candidatus Nealsonbacteria bacterium RIFOXYD1_FULL_39_11]